MEAASRSALEPLKEELEPLPDSDGPAPVKAASPSPADAALSSTQELVSMESLMGWSDLASRAVVETPPPTDSLMSAELMREEARKLEELLDSLSNSPLMTSDTGSHRATSELPVVAASETSTAIESQPGLTSKFAATDLTVSEPRAAEKSAAVAATPASAANISTRAKAELPPAATLNMLESPDLPLEPLPLELEKPPQESVPSPSAAVIKGPSELSVAEPLALPPAALAPSASTARVAAASSPGSMRRPVAVAAPAVTRPATKPAPAPTKPARPVVKAVPANAPVKPANAASAISGTAPTSATPVGKITAYPSATPSAAPAPNVMDRDFIARNQIVERYLSGKLPVKGAADFERFCHDYPELLDEIGLPQRVHAGLRLLEASGKPEPWQETRKKFWQNPAIVFSFMGAAVALAIVAVTLGNQITDKNTTIAKLKQDLVTQPLEPAATTRIIRILPNREGSTNTPAVTIGGGTAQLCDLRIDMSRSAFRAFRVTIDRIDQGRVAVLQNIYKDSNGHVRIALNSSALGPGNYSFSIDGVTWRGETVPEAWVTIGIQR